MEPTAAVTPLRWGLVVLGFVLAGWSFQSRGKALGRAEVAEERADSLYRAALDYESAYRSVAVQADMAIRVAEERRDSAVAASIRAERRRPAVIERVVLAAGPDSSVVRAAVQEVADSIVAIEVVPLRVALAATDSILVARAHQLAASEAVNAALHAALEASRTEARSWENAAKPKLFGLFHMEAGPAFIAGAVLGLAVGFR